MELTKRYIDFTNQCNVSMKNSFLEVNTGFRVKKVLRKYVPHFVQFKLFHSFYYVTRVFTYCTYVISIIYSESCLRMIRFITESRKTPKEDVPFIQCDSHPCEFQLNAILIWQSRQNCSYYRECTYLSLIQRYKVTAKFLYN